MAIVAIVTNCPSIGLPYKSEIEMESTCSLTPTYLLGFLKLYLFNVSLKSPSFFLLLQKFSQTWILERIYEKKKNKLENKKVDLFLET
jgi:hypothetical protein